MTLFSVRYFALSSYFSFCCWNFIVTRHYNRFRYDCCSNIFRRHITPILMQRNALSFVVVCCFGFCSYCWAPRTKGKLSIAGFMCVGWCVFSVSVEILFHEIMQCSLYLSMDIAYNVLANKYDKTVSNVRIIQLHFFLRLSSLGRHIFADPL